MRPHQLPTAVILSVALSATEARTETASGTEFQQALAGFGQINTIAGRGFTDVGNDWLPAAEGGPATAAELSRPHMAQADAAGNVYIADKDGHAIRKVDTEGNIHTIAGTGVRGNGGEGLATSIPLREPNGVFVLPDGTVYILEVDGIRGMRPTPGGKIRRLGKDGMLTTVIDDPELLTGRGLWVSPDESRIYYCSFDVVKKWTTTGGLETFATGFTQTLFEGIGNLDIDPISGLVCVTDRGNHRVYRLSADGTTRTVIAGNGATGGATEGGLATETALEQVRGIAFRPDGSYFLCTHKGEHAVWFVDTAGRIWKFIDGANNQHSGDGTPVSLRPQNAISEPRAIAIAPNGDLLITERDEGHIRRVTNICVRPELVRFDTDENILTWTSHREATYRLEHSTGLSTWQTISTLPASNGPTTSADLPGSTDGFFRAALTE